MFSAQKPTLSVMVCNVYVYVHVMCMYVYPSDYFVVRASFSIKSLQSKEIQCKAHTVSSWVFEKYRLFEGFIKLSCSSLN